MNFEPKFNETKQVEFKKGHYNSLTSSLVYSRNIDVIPNGYFHGTDVYIDDKGYIRARPIVQHLTEEGEEIPIAVVYWNGQYFMVQDMGKIQYYDEATESWIDVESSPTYDTDNGITIDFLRYFGSSVPET